MLRRFLIVGVGASLVVASNAEAQTQEVAPEALREAALTDTATTIPDGWRVTAKLGGAFNVTDARNVVGATEGTAIQLGLNVTGEAAYKKGQHTWDNVLKIQEAIQRTPPPDDDTPAPFVKSLDNLDFVSTYIYRFSEPDWLGPFAQFKLTTQLFPTTTEPTQAFRILRIDTAGNEVLDTDDRGVGSEVEQTKSFEPLLLRQTAGLYGQPIAEDKLTVDFKVGVGAQQIIARNGFNLVDVDTSGTRATAAVYVLQEIADTVDLGVEASAAAKGYVVKDVLTWNASAVMFLPAVTSGDVVKVDSDGNVVRENDDPNGAPVLLGTFDRINLEFNAGLSLKLTKYLAAEWALLVRRFPQIRDAYQVQNSFLLTVTMDLI